MAANRDPQCLLLFLLLVHLSDSSSLTTASQVKGLVTKASEPRLEDYDINYEDPDLDSVTRRVTNFQQCNYNPCLDGQRPCHELAVSSNCLCPGLSSRLEPPEAPTLMELTSEDSGVVVLWCAPYSEVTAYKVTVATGKPLEFGLSQRRGDVGEVTAGAQVCVVAVNNAGDSPPSCLAYKPSEDSSGVALKAGLIGGALGFLLFLSLAILLWRLRARRKASVSR